MPGGRGTSLGTGVDFDSDGDSRSAQDGDWTELTLERPGYPEERVDIDPVSTDPLVLKVAMPTRPGRRSS